MNKKLLLIIILIGITIWNIPETTSLFYNQHSFYNNSAPCQKCHQDIQDILTLPQSPEEHYEIGCQGCHTRDGNTSHAAKIVYCNNCHEVDKHQQVFNTSCSTCHMSHGGQKYPVSEVSCANCHTNPSNIHHLMLQEGRTTFGCMDCHPRSGNSIVVERTCLNCHGTTFWENPNINLEMPHHNFTEGTNISMCITCHGGV